MEFQVQIPTNDAVNGKRPAQDLNTTANETNYPNKVHVLQFTDVTNPFELKKAIIGGQDEELSKLLFLDAALIKSLSQIHLAIVKSYTNETKKTNNLGAEIVFNLWWKRNLNDAFRQFGLTEKTQSVIVLGFGFSDLQSFTSSASKFVSGSAVSADEPIGNFCDEERLRKVFKLNKEEDTLKGVMERMATRDIL